MKNFVTLLLVLLLQTHDVVTLKGLTMEEVVIVTTSPCDNCEEIVCTIATIEPANSNYKYEKYIADPLQVNILKATWQDKSDATSFEKCANEAISANAKMFLFNDDLCKISQFAFEKKDQCSINQTQMVYIEADALPDIRAAASYRTNDFFTPYDVAEARDHAAECAKFGAKACAPETSEDIVDYTTELKDFAGDFGLQFVVGLFSDDLGYNFKWITEIIQPMDIGQNGWNGQEPFDPDPIYFVFECAKMTGSGINTMECDSFAFCCSVPHNEE